MAVSDACWHLLHTESCSPSRCLQDLLFRLCEFCCSGDSLRSVYVRVCVGVCVLVLFELGSTQTGFALQPETGFPLYTVPDARL